jgi:hypothetical protein
VIGFQHETDAARLLDGLRGKSPQVQLAIGGREDMGGAPQIAGDLSLQPEGPDQPGEHDTHRSQHDPAGVRTVVCSQVLRCAQRLLSHYEDKQRENNYALITCWCKDWGGFEQLDENEEPPEAWVYLGR